MEIKLARICLALGTLSASMLVSCGHSSSSTGGSTAPTPQSYAAAAATASNNTKCTTLSPFYWEIGDANGSMASGTGGTIPAAAPNPNTAMLIASASKWLFSTYVVELQTGALSANDVKYLNFTSGYTNFKDCTTSSTVASCLLEAGTNGGFNGDYISSTDTNFYYDSGHMQHLASTIGLGLDNNAKLATDVQSILNVNAPFFYSQPQLAGGVFTSPAYYAQFLRKMLGGAYPHMLSLLGTGAVCTHTHTPTDCPTAIYSPVNESAPGVLTNDVTDEAWHYSLGHWVEDDPSVGDGAFSSAGAFGFYPWIDHGKKYYGILARYNSIQASAGVISAACGRLIRKAWETGLQQ